MTSVSCQLNFAKNVEPFALLRFWEKWSMGEEGRAGGSGWQMTQLEAQKPAIGVLFGTLGLLLLVLETPLG